MHRKRGKQLPQIVFLGLPTLLFLFVIMIPLVMSIVYSLTDWDGISNPSISLDFTTSSRYSVGRLNLHMRLVLPPEWPL